MAASLMVGFGDSSSSSSPSAASKGTMGTDPFVSSAPLIVAAVCSDGVALIALHTAFAEEPLLLDFNEVGRNRTSPTPSTDKGNTTTTNTTVEIQDVPRSYRGPFRIYEIDSFGTGMVSAGWRPHGQMVADYCRDMASDELLVYGSPRMTLTYCMEYGQYLARKTSQWMAYTAVLREHAWSCVSLLATCSSSGNGVSSEDPSSSPPGGLWLVDSTGAYRVRAHAVGGGPLAGIVNQYLAQRLLGEREAAKDIPTAEQMVRDVLLFLSQQPALVPSGTRAELAIVSPDSSGKARLKRIFASRLIGVKSSS